MKRLGYIAPLAVFLVLSLYFGIGLTRDPKIIPSVLIDRPVPEFDLPPIAEYAEGLANTDLDGEVSLVNIFGSWCVACLVEHPLLMQLAADGEVPIYGIDWRDKPGAGTAWLRKHGDPYAGIGDDFDGRTAIDFGVTGAPETFVVDATGRIRYKQIGPITPEVWEDTLAPLIESLKDG